MRATIATVLLGLTIIAGCSSGSDTSSPVVQPLPTTSSTPSTTQAACTEFATSPYIGQGLGKANDIRALGWTYLLWDEAGSPSWESGANGKTWLIGGVEKDLSTCSARFKVIPGPTIAAAAPLTPTAPAGPLTTVSDGTYLVGTDMEPGSYKSPGSSRGCYWARLKDDSGTNIIANDLGDGPMRFTAKKGEYVKINRCTFTKI